jgi:hypothetical protein
MRIYTIEREYALYTESDGSWTMHVWNRLPDYYWLATFRNVQDEDPFVSEVEYSAWR